MEIDRRIWKSYVWHKNKCWFVSTIERDFTTYAGVHRGQETLVWEYDYHKAERGKLIRQAGNICDHQTICRNLINDGVIPGEDDVLWDRFR